MWLPVASAARQQILDTAPALASCPRNMAPHRIVLQQECQAASSASPSVQPLALAAFQYWSRDCGAPCCSTPSAVICAGAVGMGSMSPLCLQQRSKHKGWDLMLCGNA
jgi:hypothetical protein